MVAASHHASVRKLFANRRLFGARGRSPRGAPAGGRFGCAGSRGWHRRGRHSFVQGTVPSGSPESKSFFFFRLIQKFRVPVFQRRRVQSPSRRCVRPQTFVYRAADLELPQWQNSSFPTPIRGKFDERLRVTFVSHQPAGTGEIGPY